MSKLTFKLLMIFSLFAYSIFYMNYEPKDSVKISSAQIKSGRAPTENHYKAEAIIKSHEPHILNNASEDSAGVKNTQLSNSKFHIINNKKSIYNEAAMEEIASSANIEDIPYEQQNF